MLDSVVPVGSHLSSCSSLGSDGVHSWSLSTTLTSGTPHTWHDLPRAVFHGDGHRHCVLPGLPTHVLGRVLEAGVLWSAQCEAAVGAAVPAEGVVPASELASHLRNEIYHDLSWSPGEQDILEENENPEEEEE